MIDFRDERLGTLQLCQKSVLMKCQYSANRAALSIKMSCILDVSLCETIVAESSPYKKRELGQAAFISLMYNRKSSGPSFTVLWDTTGIWHSLR